MKRPTCCNIGCSKPCHVSNYLKSRPIYRPYCGQCHLASMGRKDYAEGVTPAKKSYCENSDARLGFKCFSKGVKMPSFMLDLDHISGNHHNNRINNLQTLCKCCHSAKTKMFGDGSNQYRYA
jgi:5-methylcytosine-specific restriction endonuclease McrA